MKYEVVIMAIVRFAFPPDKFCEERNKFVIIVDRVLAGLRCECDLVSRWRGVEGAREVFSGPFRLLGDIHVCLWAQVDDSLGGWDYWDLARGMENPHFFPLWAEIAKASPPHAS